MPTLNVKNVRRVAPQVAPTFQQSTGAFQAESQAIRRAEAQGLQLGVDVISLTDKLLKAQEARIYDEGMLANEKFLDEQATKRRTDPNHKEKRPKFERDHDVFVESLEDMTPALKKDLDRSRTVQATRIEADAFLSMAREERANLPFVIQANNDARLIDWDVANEQWEEQMARGRRAGFFDEAGELERRKIRAKGMLDLLANESPAIAVEAFKNQKVMDAYLTEQEIKLLDADDLRQMEQSAKRELAHREAENTVALEGVQEKQRQDIVDRFLAEDFTDIKKFINSQGALEVKEKEQWMGKADNWAKQVNEEIEITTDALAESELERQALSIASGAVSREEFFENAIEARYGDKPTIDDAAFEEVTSLANREHKTYQANAMDEAYSAGRDLVSQGQLELIAAAQVTAEEDINVVLKRLGGQRKLEEENFRQYKRAMSQWFESEVKAGRDPDDDDIYKKSRTMLVHYRGRPLDESIFTEDFDPEAKAKREKLAGFLRGAPPSVGKFKPPPGVLAPTTKAEYDALPAGTRYIHPDLGEQVKQ